MRKSGLFLNASWNAASDERDSAWRMLSRQQLDVPPRCFVPAATMGVPSCLLPESPKEMSASNAGYKIIQLQP